MVHEGGVSSIEGAAGIEADGLGEGAKFVPPSPPVLIHLAAGGSISWWAFFMC